MAVNSHARIGSRPSLTAATSSGVDALPAGSCNFRDLSLGARAPVCGCKRFWLNAGHSLGPDTGSERAWCFCGHHACFHNAFSQLQQTQESHHLGVGGSGLNAGMEVLGVEHFENIPRGNEAPPSEPAQPRSPSPSKPPAGLGIQSASQHEDQSINTRVWQALNDFARSQEDGGMSGSASKLPSTTAPSVVEENRLSPQRIMRDCLQLYRPMAPPVNTAHCNVSTVPAEEYSATEVATPSIAGTPDLRGLQSSSSLTRMSPAHLQRGLVQPPSASAEVTRQDQLQVPHSTSSQPVKTTAPAGVESPVMSSRDMQSMLQAYGRRLDLLESVSFSHIPIDELQDRFELIDGRLIDLEQWRTEQETLRSSPEDDANPSRRRHRVLPSETKSFGSDGSVDLNAAAHTETVVLATLAATAETAPRIDDLEARVADLESRSLPSFLRPWHVQVVMLPWGHDLKGIWFSAEDSTQHSVRSIARMSDEWSGAQSATKLSFNTSLSGAWTTESIRAWANDAQEWLSPKACGPNGAVFQRLASRGLVRDVELTAPDARHILDAVNIAFGTFFRVDKETEGTGENYQGLNENFVPLRKVRKSSRLRFLSRSELVTSTSWTAELLDSSVFMKAKDGHRRLYITTPDSYLQTTSPGWSWNNLRELPVSNGEDQAAQADNTAIGACWSYNDVLDHSASLHSSFASHGSWSVQSQFDQSNAQEEERGGGGGGGGGGEGAADIDGSQTHLLGQQADAIHLLHRRTVSLPSSLSTPSATAPAPSKRRVASFEEQPTIPLRAGTEHIQASAITSSAIKRRRISSDYSPPDLERRGVNFTPRQSREPPSPYTSDVRSQGTSSRNRRGTTPFAYATPHSNTAPLVRLESMLGDGDTEADTEMGDDNAVVAADGAARSTSGENGEEVWNGLDEGERLGETGVEEGDDDDDDDVDDDDEPAQQELEESDEADLDDGLAVYSA